jgi:hypothetical protein
MRSGNLVFEPGEFDLNRPGRPKGLTAHPVIIAVLTLEIITANSLCSCAAVISLMRGHRQLWRTAPGHQAGL